jgi:DNA-binding transcriptional MerR regulator
VGDNGYRYYSDDALFQLQQILLYREIELDLLQIKAIMADEAFDLVSAFATASPDIATKNGASAEPGANGGYYNFTFSRRGNDE